jgi:hypothetical protein
VERLWSAQLDPLSNTEGIAPKPALEARSRGRGAFVEPSARACCLFRSRGSTPSLTRRYPKPRCRRSFWTAGKGLVTQRTFGHAQTVTGVVATEDW